jgi:hypothetical protein
MKDLIALIALRYRLVWAHARSSQGRIVLLVVGYLAIAAGAVLFAIGGVGAAAVSIRLGRAGMVAAVVLAGLHLNAAFASVFLGIGVNPALSDATLRRYPLSRVSRLAATHVTALLEPLWLVVLAVAIGLASGFAAMEVGSAWFGVPAALLFVISTYQLACLITRVGAWVVSRPGGPLLVIVAGTGLMMAAPLAPAWLAFVATRPGGPSLPAFLEWTAPFAAGRAMTTSANSQAMTYLAILIAWSAVLAVLLSAANRLPRHSRSRSGVRARWDHPLDTVAAAFGRASPLAGKMLRYCLRSPQTRYNYPLALPVFGVMIATNSERDSFLFALGAAPALGTLATGTLSMNLFGFDGHGFRRYFLLPVKAVDVLRTAALVSLMPGALLVPIGVVAWWALTSEPVTARMVLMLVCAGVGGLFSFQAGGLWTTLLAPRAIPFDMTFGNKLSPAANLLFVLAMVVFFGGPLALTALGVDAVLKAWWIAPFFLGGAVVFYVFTLRAGARVLVNRREHLLSVIEGR